MKYQKIPIEVEAYQFMPDNINFLKEWAGMQCSGDETTDFYFIPTLEGNMRVLTGDYVIKGVRGEFYPCRREIFYETYMPVEQSLDDIKREWANDILDTFDEENACVFCESIISCSDNQCPQNKESK